MGQYPPTAVYFSPLTSAAIRSPAALHPTGGGSLVPSQFASRPVVVYGVGPHQSSPPVIQNNYAGLANLMNKFNPLLSYGLPSVGNLPALPEAAPQPEIGSTTFQPPVIISDPPPVAGTAQQPLPQYQSQPLVTAPPVLATSPPTVTAPPIQPPPVPTAPPPAVQATAPPTTLPIPVTTAPPLITLPPATESPPVALQPVTTTVPENIVAPSAPELAYPSRIFYSMTQATTTSPRPPPSLLESATETDSVPQDGAAPVSFQLEPIGGNHLAAEPARAEVDNSLPSITDTPAELVDPAAPSWTGPPSVQHPFTNWPSTSSSPTSAPAAGSSPWTTNNPPAAEETPAPVQQHFELPQASAEPNFDPYNRAQWPQPAPSHFQVAPSLTAQVPQQPVIQWTSAQEQPVGLLTTSSLPVDQPQFLPDPPVATQWPAQQTSSEHPQQFLLTPVQQWPAASPSGPLSDPTTTAAGPSDQPTQFLLTPFGERPYSSTPSLIQGPFQTPVTEGHHFPPATPIPPPPLADPSTSSTASSTSVTPEQDPTTSAGTTTKKGTPATPAKAAMKPYFRNQSGKSRPFNKPSVATTSSTSTLLPSSDSGGGATEAPPSTTQRASKATRAPHHSRPKANAAYKTTPASLAPTTPKSVRTSANTEAPSAWPSSTSENPPPANTFFQPSAPAADSLPSKAEPIAEILTNFQQIPAQVPSDPQFEIQKTPRPSYQRPTSTSTSTSTTTAAQETSRRPSYQRPSPPPEEPSSQPIQPQQQEIALPPPQTFFNSAGASQTLDHPQTESAPQPVVHSFFHLASPPQQDTWASSSARPIVNEEPHRPPPETRKVYISQSHPESVPSPPPRPKYAAQSPPDYPPLVAGHQAFAHLPPSHGGDYSAIPGEPGADYPIYDDLPATSFKCSDQRLPGYYGDMSSRCQMFHVCWEHRQWSFLCPNGTIFSQRDFVCVWWHQFECAQTASYFDQNAKLFIVPPANGQQQYGGGPPEYYNKQSRTLDVSGADQNTVEPVVAAIIPPAVAGYTGSRLVNRTAAAAAAAAVQLSMAKAIDSKSDPAAVVLDSDPFLGLPSSGVAISELLMAQEVVTESSSTDAPTTIGRIADGLLMDEAESATIRTISSPS